MTLTVRTEPSRGRLFKLFTDLGPYFRKLQSTESSFFFDCLEICINSEDEPEQREFYGWWLVVTREENIFYFQRFDGIYNLAGDWVTANLCKQDLQQLDHSFELFVKRLETLINAETGLRFEALPQVVLTEV